MQRIMGAGLLAVLAACAPRGSAGDADAPDLLPSVQATSVGDSVQFVLQLTNTTDEAVDLEFTSGQSYDFVVRSPAGEEVWRWSADRAFTQALREEVLAAGETLTYSVVWAPPPGMSGEHEVTGILTARNHPIQQSAAFTIPGGPGGGSP